MWVDMNVVCLASGCDIPWHLLVLNSRHLLVWGEYHWQLVPCVLVSWVPGRALSGPDIDKQCHFVWLLAQSYFSTDVSLTSSGSSIHFSCSFCNNFLNGYWSAHDIHMGSTCFGLRPSITCNENVPLNHPIPEYTSLNVWFCYTL